jgi:hypothetical protein
MQSEIEDNYGKMVSWDKYLYNFCIPGKIPYSISSQYSSYSRSVIASAMNEYTANTCIQWVPRTATDKDYGRIFVIIANAFCFSLHFA